MLLAESPCWCFSGHFSPVQIHFPQAQALKQNTVSVSSRSEAQFLLSDFSFALGDKESSVTKQDKSACIRYSGLTSHCSPAQSRHRPCISSRWEYKLKNISIKLKNSSIELKIFSSNSNHSSHWLRITEFLLAQGWQGWLCCKNIFDCCTLCKVK